MTKMNTVIALLTMTAMSLSAQAADKAATKEATKEAPKKVEKIDTTKVQPGKYAIDSTHSKVGFEIPHLVISTVEGKFTKFDGEVELTDKLATSKVTANVDVSSIDTSNADRDNHLKSADFFDVATPANAKMTFVSKKMTGDFKKFKMTGDLTIKGKTKEVTFEGKFLGTVVDAYGNTKAAFDVTTVINRQDFGLTWSKLVEAGPAVGDKVTISLKIQAAKAK